MKDEEVIKTLTAENSRLQGENYKQYNEMARLRTLVGSQQVGLNSQGQKILELQEQIDTLKADNLAWRQAFSLLREKTH